MRSAEQKMLNAVQRPGAYREVVIGSGGVSIVLSVWDGTPGEPAVVFLPGTMTHPLFYEDLLDALSRDGLTVVGLHAQAHGKSPRTRRPLTFGTLVRNAADAVAWTRGAYPGRPVAVLGSSQGGILAVALAARHPVDAVFAHNIMDPALRGTIAITRFPRWLSRLYPGVVAAIRLAARAAPGLPVPFGAYLDIRRVCRDDQNAAYFYSDPLGRRSYPLRFMASLLTADMWDVRNGSIRCPVTVIASRGDPLFPLSYIREVFGQIAAPHKDLVVVESKAHLLFNEDLDAVLPVLLPRLHAVRALPGEVGEHAHRRGFAALADR